MSADDMTSAGTAHFLAGGGEMGALIRATDWSQTPLGPIEGWSQSLRMMVGLLLANRFPLLLWWGPDYISIYNDAYRPILGTKHPKSLAQPVRECWSEIWHILQPLIDSPFSGGPSTWMEDLPLEINRHGFAEETHFTVAYSPVPDEAAPHGIGGVLATVHEITEKVVGERRVAALRDLGARTGEAKTAEAACAIAAETLANYPKDIPFALLYLIDGDGQQARLAGCAGVEFGEAASPPVVPLGEEVGNAAGWPLAAAARDEETIAVADLPARFATVPPGPWADQPQQALVLPIPSNKPHDLAGLLVAGVSARLKLDEQYRSFLDLVASQIATAIANARAYEEERRRAEALAEIDRAKTMFFSNISHEFRTPLTLMLGPLEDALADRELPAAERERLDVAHRNSLRLLKLVNSLLDFSRIEAGRAQASYVPTDLAALTADLASNFRSACERAGLALTVDCPPLAAPVYVDRDMWEKIVLNLLSNAFKFTFAGEITVRLRAADGHAELSVSDTGVGVPTHELSRLFERFHRIEGQRSRTYEGSGIGLALVQELVELHGGTIEAASEPGDGTTFTVRLPLGYTHLPEERIGAEPTLASSAIRAEAFVEEALRWLPDGAASEVTPANQSDAGGGLPSRYAGAHILLADDNADMRAYVRRLLGGDCDVETVADGEAALAAIGARRPDLVLADIMMPRLDGFGLIRAIRGDPQLRDLPVIVLSARAGEESRIEGIGAGADDYLVKPFGARELIARVGANIEMARMRRAAQQDLRAVSTELRQTLDTAAVGLTHCSRDLRYVAANPAYARIAGLPVERIVGHPIIEVMGAEAFAIVHPYIERVLRGERVEYEAEMPWASRERSWVRVLYVPAPDANGTVNGWVASVTDITRRKRAEQSVLGQRRIFEMVATGAALRETLDELTLFLEEGEPGMRCGILLVADDGAHFRRGSGPHLPEEYHRALDGVPITPPYLGSCGEAAHRCTPILCPDIESETRYAEEWRGLMLACGIRAGRSTAVCGADGRAVASIEMYFDHPRDPNPADPDLIDIATHLAAIAIERDRADRALRQSRKALAAELAVRRQLQETSTQLVRDGGAAVLYERIVDTAAAVMGSDFASMQMLDRGRGDLRLLAAKGFGAAAAAAWEWVGHDGGSSCAAALRSRQRVVVPDIEMCTFMTGTPDLAAYRQAGIAAVQSTPLTSRSGRLLGMISTHWREPHDPGESELGLLAVLARQAADLIEQAEADAALRELNASLETRIAERTRELADANERLQRERLLSELIVENTAEGIIVVDTDMRHVLWNAGMERINGLPRGAVLGKTVFEAFPQLQNHPVGEAWRRALAGHPTEMRDRRHNCAARGAEIVYDSDHTPLYNRDGSIIGAVCIVRETTERHRIEEMLRESQKLEAVARLTGGVAHDFNNLLTVVIGQTESIIMAAEGNERIIRMATAAQQVAERGARLTSQLLAFARRQNLRPETLQIGQLMTTAGDLLRRAVGEAITLEFDIAPELWALRCDPVQFEAALLNLAVNARDAMDDSGKVLIEARNAVIRGAEAQRLDLNPGNYVMVRVSDTGPGMPAEVLERCFDPFFTTKDVGKGTGLGLSQVYGFARQSDGTAIAESKPGDGTTIRLYLPGTETQAAAAAPPPRALPAAKGHGETVLLVEDQPDVRELMQTWLTELGYRIVTAPDGVHAEKLLRSRRHIDLLLTDIVMPNGVSGLALAASARRLRPKLKMVLISGYSRERYDGEFIFLEKPFRQAELAAKVADALSTAASAN